MCRICLTGSDIITNQEKAILKISESNPNFIILSEFKGWRENIQRQCKICGDIRTVKARSLVEKNKYGDVRGCIVCKNKIRGAQLKKTHDEYAQDVWSMNPHVKFLSTYNGNDNKIKCKCLLDGCEWETRPNSLMHGHGCPECANRKQNRRTEEQFLQELKQLRPTIISLEKFNTMNTSMKFKCSVCDYEWNTSPMALFRESYCGCPKCNNTMHFISEDEFLKRLSSANNRVKYIHGYKNMSSHAYFECLKCGHKWNTLVSSVLSGRGCPKCNLSHGALQIQECLDNLNIDYEMEYRFEDCKDIRPLPFDFYIDEKRLCIEYDGEQHFHPVRFHKNETDEQMQDKFLLQQKRDLIKTNYCKDNNIALLRIPYTEFNNINEILNKYFS